MTAGQYFGGRARLTIMRRVAVSRSPCPRPLPRLCPRARPASPRAWFLQLQVSLKCHIFCVIVFLRPPGHHVFIISVYGNQPFQEETNSEHSQDQDIPVLLYCSCHSAEGSWQRSWCLVSVMVQGQWVSWWTYDYKAGYGLFSFQINCMFSKTSHR